MLTKSLLIGSLSVVLLNSHVSADPLVYVVNLSQQFGTLDIATGAFQQIGPNTPEGVTGLGASPNGSLVSLTFSGNLDSINPGTGMISAVGPTGLGDCSMPTSPCGPMSGNTLGSSAGKIYATDFQNSLYTVNPLTGAATLLTHTGMPALPFVPGSQNADGTFNLYDEAIWGAGGKLYATFDAFVFDFSSNMVASVLVPPKLYQIDPSTGLATVVGPTELAIGAATDVNGTSYAFGADLNNMTFHVATLDLSNGRTTFVSNYDPAAGTIIGASPVVPEPGSVALTAIGIIGLAVCRRRKRTPRCV